MVDMTVKEKKETLGGYRVGLSFNPSKIAVVDEIKDKTAELITLLENLRVEEQNKDNKEVQRLISLAQTHYENGAMWGVKGATKHLLK
jgi:hypothetical protein